MGPNDGFSFFDSFDGDGFNLRQMLSGAPEQERQDNFVRNFNTFLANGSHRSDQPPTGGSDSQPVEALARQGWTGDGNALPGSVTFRKPQAEPVFSPQGQEYAFTNAFHDFVYGKGLSKPWPTSSGPDLGVGMLPQGSLLNAHHQAGEGVAQAGSGTAASAEAPGSAPTRKGGEIVVPLHEGNSSSANGAPGSSAGAGSPAPQPATGQSGKPRVPTREPSSYVIGDLTQPSESAQPKKGATDFQFDKEFTGHLTQEDIDEQVRMEKERKSWNLLKGIDPNQDKRILMPIEGRIRSSYGYRKDPFTGEESFHDGIDIPRPLNTPVRAATYGEVVGVRYHDRAGNYIVVADVNGRLHEYMHTGSKVQVGQKVQQGQMIGFIDNSGRSTGPHLHYQIKDRVGNLMNPEWEMDRWK